MKYILVLIIIIGIVTYIFLGSPKPKDEATAGLDRRQEVWERIASLEAQRREMLTRAKGRMGSGPNRSRMTSQGVYYAGYRDGFTQGYYEGSFLSASRTPDPLFFKVPNP
ncbi:hypothetical protein [Desulfovibrio sp. TomC]|uniref:hypothetical protein n=1 Tax=Desulfovibrio sp. TomC TaxID=1562888 RepID=UPI0005735CC5|nr:hypothetical protein [Desulfovibrio sp. TomC]KHK02613.1 hypothetical protein NY78_1970 [Desulfovibrio sp. TomC]